MPLPAPNIEKIRKYVRSALDLNDQSALLSLSDEDAQIALDEMWKLLDSPAHPDADISQLHATRNKLRRLSLKLAIKHDKLPLALFLQDVQCKDMNHRGAGGFADVFCGSADSIVVAIKRLRVYVMSSETEKIKLKQAFYRESLLWKNLIHKHVLPFLGVSEDVFPGTICMVLPWMDNGSIRHHIDTLQRQGKLAGTDFAVAVDIWLYEVGLGLVYLHDEGIVHGDLHGGNILVDANGSIRLTDFGMALISEASAYNYASMHGGGASRWQAPELIDPEEFGFTSSRPTYCSDVYSFGCTCIELYTGAPPFAGLTERQAAMRILKGSRPSRPSISDGSTMSDAMWSLVTSCWTEKPSDRPLAAGVVQSLAKITSPVEIIFTSTPEKREEAPDTLLEDMRARLTALTVQHEENMKALTSLAETTPDVEAHQTTATNHAEPDMKAVEPVTMDEDKIQRVIAKIGSCSNGYRWQKEDAGYRCMGGAHFLTNAQVEDELAKEKAEVDAVSEVARADAADVQRILAKIGGCDQGGPYQKSDERGGYICLGGGHFVSFAQVEKAIQEEKEVSRDDFELKIQKKIRDSGKCPQDYSWIKEPNGYRCAGGSHFLSNADLGISS